MAERLTEKVGAIGCEYLCIEDYDTVVNKLGKLEDILEEFNISSINELHEYLCWEQEQRKELDKIYKVWVIFGNNTVIIPHWSLAFIGSGVLFGILGWLFSTKL